MRRLGKGELNGEEGAEREFMSPPSVLEMITKRYAKWNLENLKRIQERGYRRFIGEMQEKVKNGFLTSDVISPEMVVTEFLEKMQ